ncbi:MAG: hypothetical protein ACLFQB_07940 [Chitinispirillaceae bacterium]
MHRSYTLFIPIILILNLISTIHADDSKSRIEKEFVQLENDLFKHVKSTIKTTPDLDSMNNAFLNYISENPGVYRILRTNSGGFIVNDVNSRTVTPNPTRNISGQEWLQTVTETKKPYHSANTDSTGNVVLFWAHPLLSGSEQISGTLAAFIDLTTVLALMQDTGSFQVTYEGKAFFEHNWEDLDFTEEPLKIKGTENVSIRIPKPFTLGRSENKDTTESTDSTFKDSAELTALAITDTAASDSSENSIKPQKSGSEPDKSISDRTRKNLLRFTGLLAVFLLSPALALILIRRQKGRKNGTFCMEEADQFSPSKSQTSSGKVLIPSLSEKKSTLKPHNTEHLSQRSEVNTPKKEENSRNDSPQENSSNSDEIKETMRHMQDEIVELLAEEISRLDKEVEKLNRRIEDLERR